MIFTGNGTPSFVVSTVEKTSPSASAQLGKSLMNESALLSSKVIAYYFLFDVLAFLQYHWKQTVMFTEMFTTFYLRLIVRYIC